MAETKAPLLRAYLIVGSDELKRQAAVARIKRYVDEGLVDFNLDELTASADMDPASLVASLDTMPFGPGPRLVIVHDAGKLPKAVSEALITYLDNPNPSSVLCLEAESLAKGTRLYKAVAKQDGKPIVECAAKKAWELPAYVAQLCQRTHGKRMGEAAAKELVGRVGESTVLLDAQVRTLAELVGDRPEITLADVEEHVARTAEVKPWEFLDAVSGRDARRALALYQSMADPSQVALLTLLVGRIRGENFKKLNSDISKPLFNRALQAQYPPGSIFKVAQAMIALHLGVITPQTGFVCDKVIGCHNHPSARSVQEAIKMSCNPYFYYTYRRVIQQGKYKNIYKDSQYGLTVWHDYMTRFGFGYRLPIDLPNVKQGNIPDTAFYNKWYGRERWAFTTIYSNSIGQGEVEVVPLQMANLACIVANRGYFYTPHLVRYYGPDSIRPPEFYEKHETGIEREYFDIAARGMYDVVHGAGGTAHKADIPDIDVCGKTGTAENYGNDHSVFIAFAPKDKPKIAVAVYVENAQGGGGTWAAPIASLIIEKYIRGEVKRTDMEKYYTEINPCQKLPLTRRIKKPRKR